VADYVHLASNGLITNEKTIRERPELVRALVAAILKGVEDAIAQPEAAFENAHDYVEGLAEADQDVQKAVLEASVGFWVAEHLGHSDGDAWTNMQEILLEMGLLDAPLDLQSAYTNEFIP
jgi:NitT/TauT family transport system substrate-binding protein